MATRARSELFCLNTPNTEKNLAVLTCEDLNDDWIGFRCSPETPDIRHSVSMPLTVSRSIRIDCGGVSTITLSRSASIDETGQTLHRGNVRAQMRRAFVNISGLLAAAGASWSDTVRASCFVRDLAKDAPVFSEEFQAFCYSQEV